MGEYGSELLYFLITFFLNRMIRREVLANFYVFDFLPFLRNKCYYYLCCLTETVEGTTLDNVLLDIYIA